MFLEQKAEHGMKKKFQKNKPKNSTLWANSLIGNIYRGH